MPLANESHSLGPLAPPDLSAESRRQMGRSPLDKHTYQVLVLHQRERTYHPFAPTFAPLSSGGAPLDGRARSPSYGLTDNTHPIFT